MGQHKRSSVLAESGLLVLLLLVVVPVELICAKAAYETLGEVASVFYWIVVVGGNVLVVGLAVGSRYVAGTLALLVGLAIIPYQVVLMDRLSCVQAEAARIVAYAYETKLRTGVYPADLSEYTYAQPRMREYIQRYQMGLHHGGFELMYRVGTETTSHWYSPREGWMYYPD